MTKPRDPGETFIGVGLETDPFSLLGLPVAPATESEVLAALGARMSDIADHRRGQTPEANELRLALHAAAAQLLDPQLQELLLHSNNERPSEPSQAAQSGDAPKEYAEPVQRTSSSVETSVADHIRHDLILVVAANGGWDSVAMRRVAMLAHARGIPSSELPTILSSYLSTHTPSTLQETETQPDTEVRTGSIASTEPSVRRKRSQVGSLIGTSAIAMLTVVSLLLVWARLTAVPTSPNLSTQNQTEVPRKSTANTTERSPQNESIPRPTLTPNSAARQLAGIASSRDPLNSDQLNHISTINQYVAGTWVDLDHDLLTSIHNSILEILYQHSSDTKSILEFVSILSRDCSSSPSTADEVARSAWSVGVLARFAVERNLPTAVDASILSRLAAFSTDSSIESAGTFTDGVLASLSVMSGQMATQQVNREVWTAWIRALSAVTTDNAKQADEHRFSAIESLCVSGPEPTQSRPTFDAIELLCENVVLEPSGYAAQKIVGWLGDNRFSSADLAIITRVTISKSSIAGVDESLVLSSSADSARRMAVRTSLESILLGIDEGSSEAIEQWQSIAQQELRHSPADSTAQRLKQTVKLSRLSAAARSTFWGDYPASQQVLANFSDDLDRIANASPGRQQYLGGDGSLDWATRYLSARQNIPVREALLSELTRGRHVLGTVAAEALVKDAFFGTPATIRAQAREVVRIHAQSPAVLNAVLEYLPRIPKIDSSSDVIEALVRGSLPAASDPNWPFRARQLLTESLLLLVSGQGEGEIVDRLVEQLSASYQLRLSSSSQSEQAPTTIELQESARYLYEFWRAAALSQNFKQGSGARIEEIEMNRIGRLSLADGIIARFAANQVSAVEMMAIVIENENSARASDVRKVVSTMSQNRRTSNNIIDQIHHVEAAAVNLWMIRMGGDIE